MDIRENIKFILKTRGMTQGALAEKLGVSTRTVMYYLKGNITIETLQKMAEAMDTTVETLVSETPLHLKIQPIPNNSNITSTTMVCPHCGKEITLIAKDSN